MNEWLPNRAEHTAFAGAVFQLTIRFHKKKKKKHIWL